jgi:hypothetical protein
MSADQEASLDSEVRRYIYAMEEGLPPTVAETASALSVTPDEVGASFRRLADGHILVLQKGNGEIRGPLVGRHSLQLKDDAALLVRRARREVVQGLEPAPR